MTEPCQCSRFGTTKPTPLPVPVAAARKGCRSPLKASSLPRCRPSRIECGTGPVEPGPGDLPGAGQACRAVDRLGRQEREGDEGRDAERRGTPGQTREQQVVGLEPMLEPGQPDPDHKFVVAKLRVDPGGGRQEGREPQGDRERDDPFDRRGRALQHGRPSRPGSPEASGRKRISVTRLRSIWMITSTRLKTRPRMSSRREPGAGARLADHQHELLDGRRGAVGVDGRDGPGVPGVDVAQVVVRLVVAQLREHDPVRLHAQTGHQQVLHRHRRDPGPVAAEEEPAGVGVREDQLLGVLDGDQALVEGDLGDHGLGEGGLARARGAGDDDVQPVGDDLAEDRRDVGLALGPGTAPRPGVPSPARNWHQSLFLPPHSPRRREPAARRPPSPPARRG